MKFYGLDGVEVTVFVAGTVYYMVDATAEIGNAEVAIYTAA